MTCRLRSFIETYLDPGIWRLALQGVAVHVDGHLYDSPTYVIRDDREYEYRACLRCHRNVEQGWRRYWATPTPEAE